ncbi:ATP-grasp domain-containing protein [Streptomyces chattanoogensis]|uniref:ATP-grasp domain-containing protein n=1 Tax=Streptomyces chattanoogensis TaxID=66876 RepID=A0A0N0H1N1_9ACTN|nr:ATP-grasp domain-containing protein [Streptomyces chattanoogensis]KPC64370.1 hypothetical protein ADL29_12760 [Streptomyces chattanoogensis]
MHVVIVGGPRPQVLDALLGSRHEVTAVFENTPQNWERLAPYRDRLRHMCVIDSYRTVESLWSALHHMKAIAEGVDVVVALTEQAVVPAAVVASLLGARAISPDTALRCRDKAMQKRAWQETGISTARHIVTTGCEASPADLVERASLRAPFVVKPVAGLGAMHTFIVDDRAELDTLVAGVTRDHPELARLMIEERNDGTEWIIDGMVSGGEIAWIMLSRFLAPIIECTVDNPVRIISLPPAGHAAWYASATDFARRAVTALELRDSTFHFEVFGTPGAFAAGELAARPGGQMMPSLMRHVLGIDVWECAVKAATGEKPPPRTPSLRTFGYVGLPITPGQTNRVAATDLSALPGVVEVAMGFAVGETMPASRDHSGAVVGGVIVEGADEAECRASLSAAEDVVTKMNRP